ncbi:21547_t:CDS:2 [Entrophospora sp. SA101]|nr:21547_t:CDS:2 [Entrophospora sp. SA101]
MNSQDGPIINLCNTELDFNGERITRKIDTVVRARDESFFSCDACRHLAAVDASLVQPCDIYCLSSKSKRRDVKARESVSVIKEAMLNLILVIYNMK